MPSRGNSIINTLFGCCLGHRGNSSAERNDVGLGGDDGVGSDERTPLIGGRGKAAKDGSTGNNAKSLGPVAGPSGSEEQSVLARKKSVDVAKLRAIRDQANNAFFNVENSQLLPSSTSSRPMNMSNSQMFGSGSKKDQKRDETSHNELVAESDKAERLYRAAMISPSWTPGGAVDEIPSSTEEEREAPVSLVRKIEVSIREAPRRGGEELLPKAKTITSTLSNKKLSSPQEAHQKMRMDTQEATGLPDSPELNKNHHLSISKVPSLHSLRTLRLSGQFIDPQTPETDNNSTLGRHFSADDEEWARRGRTRSKRGLAWIDNGPSKVEGRVKLDQLFSEGDSNVTPSIAKVPEEEEEEVPNALRLTSKQSDTMKEVQERLRAIKSIADVWESGSQDN